MAEALIGLLGAGGVGGAISGVISQIIYQIGKFIRYAITKIWHFIRLVLHYIKIYVEKFNHYLGQIYLTFQRDPLRFIQFTGSLAILAYYGAL